MRQAYRFGENVGIDSDFTDSTAVVIRAAGQLAVHLDCLELGRQKHRLEKSDQTIALLTRNSLNAYPNRMRRDVLRYLVFLTNRFDLPAFAIAETYRNRRQIESSFIWKLSEQRLEVEVKTYGKCGSTNICNFACS